MSDHHTSSDPGSFLSGFTIGLFAGAAGYFLFATDKGMRVKKQLAKEWQLAKQDVMASETLQNSTLSIREFVKNIIDKVTPPAPTAEPKKAPARPAKPKKVTVKDDKFKGV